MPALTIPAAACKFGDFMYIFSFLLFPMAAFYAAFREVKKQGIACLKEHFLTAVSGLLCGFALCAVLEFCVFLPDYQGTGFAVFFVLQWVFNFAVPLLFFVFYILWSKDSLEFRLKGFLYFFLPLMSLYLPFWLFVNDGRQSFFMLFVFPVLQLLLVFALAGEFLRLSRAAESKAGAVFAGVFFIPLESAFPVLSLTLSYFNCPVWLWILTSAAFFVLCFFRFRCKSALRAGAAAKPV